MLGLWAWLSNDIYLLRKWTVDTAQRLDAKQQEDFYALNYDITELKRGQRRF